MYILNRTGRPNEWVNYANANFEATGYPFDELKEDDTDKELCEKIWNNFLDFGIVCLVDYTMNIDDRLTVINDCFSQLENNML